MNLIKGGLKTMLILLIILIAIVAWIISAYNGLVTLRQRVKNAWSQIDVQLQRRFDLIPNLVETVKGYMAHEADVLEKVTELRTSWAKAGTVSEKAELDNQLSGALKTIMAVSENYPDLKANQNFSEFASTMTVTLPCSGHVLSLWVSDDCLYCETASMFLSVGITSTR